MKDSRKIFIRISSAFVVVAFLAGIYLVNDVRGNGNLNGSDISSDSNAITANDDESAETDSRDNDDCSPYNGSLYNSSLYNSSLYESSLWEKEFYNCADYLMSKIQQVDASEYILPEADEWDRLQRIEVYSASWLAYMSFVANWMQRRGTSEIAREEIYRQATLLMVLIDDNHDASLGYGSIDREYYEFVYDHGKTREELLSTGNRALYMENVIDESAQIIEEEFGDIDFWNERDLLEAAAWEAEFYNCMERYAETLWPTDVQVLRLWGEFVKLWAENSEAFECIESGSGLSIWMAHRRRECFRTATLLTVYQMEQSGLDYQFIYDYEADRDFLKNAYE